MLTIVRKELIPVGTKIDKASKFLIYLILFTGLWGPALFVVRAGSFHIFPYRAFFLILLLLSVLKAVLPGGKFNVSYIIIKSYLGFLLFWLLYGAVSVIWAVSKTDAIRNLFFLFMFFTVIWCVVYYFRDIEDLYRFYYLWMFFLIFFVAIGLWEVATGHHLATSLYSRKSLINLDIKKATAVFYNPNDFSVFLALSIPFVFSFVRYGKNYLLRLAGIVLIILSIYILFSNVSRAALLSVVIEFLFILIFLTNRNIRSKVYIVVAGIISIILILYIAHFLPLDGYYIKIIKSFRFNFSPGKPSGIRLNLLKNSFYFLWKTWGMGVGAGNVEAWMKHYAIYKTYRMTNMHNWWFEIMTNYGVIIFGGYVIFFFSLLKNLYVGLKNLKNTKEKMICESLVVGLVGFILACIGSSSIMSFRFQWFFFAFCLAFLNYLRLKDYSTKK